MVWFVTVINPNDPDYLCVYTVLAESAEAAQAFAEHQNPGLQATEAVAAE